MKESVGILPTASEVVQNALIALAVRCEMEEPSRELDRAIFNAVVVPLHPYTMVDGRACLRRLSTGELEAVSFSNYATSLDAAVTLVPEECGFKIETDDWDAMSPAPNLPPSTFAAVHDKARTRSARKEATTPQFDDWQKNRGIHAHTHYCARAATPALALCAAALRARAEIGR